MDSKRPGRRRFLKEGAALAGLALGARSASGQTHVSDAHPVDPTVAYGERSRFVTTGRYMPTGDTRGALIEIYPPAHTPLTESMGIITPSGLHFTTAHGFAPPDIDPNTHRLMIHGM